ncbi:unnamed protein product [Hyaloperonospora brassicae]|uniref:Cysteine-rich protein n=1 Tax=Hyaloperonospora brassicae TaxID=162125 RepID=A0AAV0V416_HYABA|nr:unnamed protein product [Hyaloperonospora brassicae]
MTPRILALAGLLVAAFASANVPVFVHHDAVYLLPESRGLPCSDDGGMNCPKAGDVAYAGCRPGLLSYNGAVCVAPVDAQCIEAVDDTWLCTFPQTAYTSATDTDPIGMYDDIDDDDDERLRNLLSVLCDVNSGKDAYKTSRYGCRTITSAVNAPTIHTVTETGSTVNQHDQATPHTIQNGEYHGGFVTPMYGSPNDGYSANEAYPTRINDLVDDFDSIDDVYPTHHAHNVYSSINSLNHHDTYDLKQKMLPADPIQVATDGLTTVPDSYLSVVPVVSTLKPDVMTVIPGTSTLTPDVLTVVPAIVPVVPGTPTVVTDILPLGPDITTAIPGVVTLPPIIPAIPSVTPTPLTTPTFPRFQRRMRSLGE